MSIKQNMFESIVFNIIYVSSHNICLDTNEYNIFVPEIQTCIILEHTYE